MTLFGILAFGQENATTEIDIQSKTIDSDNELVMSNFDLTNEIKLKIWHKKNQIFKIIREEYTNYGEIKSEIYIVGKQPIKIIESESSNFFLPDSIAEIKGYSIDIEENFKAISYIINWNKGQRELVISGEPTKEKDISYDLNKYVGIIRKAEKLINE